MKTRSITRRRFLTTSSLALAAPAVIPSSVLGKNGAVAQSERIVLGAIGIGPRGRYVLGSDEKKLVLGGHPGLG